MHIICLLASQPAKQLTQPASQLARVPNVIVFELGSQPGQPASQGACLLCQPTRPACQPANQPATSPEPQPKFICAFFFAAGVVFVDFLVLWGDFPRLRQAAALRPLDRFGCWIRAVWHQLVRTILWGLGGRILACRKGFAPTKPRFWGRDF